VETKNRQNKLVSKEINLAGKYFHSFLQDIETGKKIVQWQGYIYGPIKDCGVGGYYLATLFEWLSGYPSDTIILHISDLINGNFSFYDSAEDMNDAYKHRFKLAIIEKANRDADQ
jgi:hypothetical protein